jgi:hypothetical protein
LCDHPSKEPSASGAERKAELQGSNERNLIPLTRRREERALNRGPALNELHNIHGDSLMKRALIASFAALSVMAAPALAATTTAVPTKVTKSEKKQAKLAAKQQKAAAKTAAKAK